MPALPPGRSCKAVHGWANRDRSLDSSIRLARRTQRMQQQKCRMQEFLQKCRNRRRLSDPHGRYAGVSPGSHRDIALGIRGLEGRK
jgi:hypothetical protein